MIDSGAIQAIIFDMDGLMLDTERLAQRAWQQAAAEWSYELPDDVFLAAVGRTAADTGKIFRTAYGADFPFEAMYERKQQLLHEIIATEGIPPKVGLYALLDQIDALGLRKAVATSTARALAELKLTNARLIARFAVIICGDEVAAGKPAPDIFLAAAHELGVSPQHCMVLEDSEAGIQAAHAAGMIPVWIPDLKPPTPETERLAHRVLRSLEEVSAMLRTDAVGE